MELCTFIKSGRRNQDVATTTQISQKIKSKIITSAGRRGIANNDGKFSRTTEWWIWKSHQCEEGKCQLKTHARIINEADHILWLA